MLQFFTFVTLILFDLFVFISVVALFIPDKWLES